MYNTLNRFSFLSLNPQRKARNLFLLGVKVLLQLDAKLLSQGLELVQVLLVLVLVLDLGLDACILNFASACKLLIK